MHWIIAVTGLLILALLAWGARRPAPPTYRDAPLDDALNAHLSALAARSEGRGRARMRMPRGMLRTFEKAVGYLNALPSGELLPAARWLCENGRFLQEEIASLGLSLKDAPKLPKTPEGVTRTALFARELMGHSAAAFTRERFEKSVAAWQEASVFTSSELDHLPLAIRLTLAELVCELAVLCVKEQRAQLCAVRAQRCLRHGREKQALRLLKRCGNEPAFLERLLSEARADADGGSALWLDQYFAQHGLSADALAQTEHDHQSESCHWVSNAIASLRAVGRVPWQRVLEQLSPVHAALCQDDTYRAMDQESRAYYSPAQRAHRAGCVCGRAGALPGRGGGYHSRPCGLLSSGRRLSRAASLSASHGAFQPHTRICRRPCVRPVPAVQLAYLFRFWGAWLASAAVSADMGAVCGGAFVCGPAACHRAYPPQA